MNKETCLQKMQLVGVLAFATVDENRMPQIRNISAIHYEPDALYFFTARGKNFCKELMEDGHVQILAYTRFKEMIRMSAKAVPAAEHEQKHWIDVIFKEQPYLENVYPGDSRDIGIIFEIKNAEIEYFNLGVNPIFRETYFMGTGKSQQKGYEIQADTCIGCGSCAESCPQRCIVRGDAGSYVVQKNHCLHCGRCETVCPVGAVVRL